MSLNKIATDSQKGMKSILDTIETEILSVHRHAQIICDLHWQNMLEEADDRSPRYITRVRVTKGSLQCIWMRGGSRPPVNKGGKIKATHIPKGTARNNPNYKSSTFNRAEVWERELIDETEANYALLRERYMMLCKVKDDLIKTSGLAKKSFDRVGIPWK